MELEILTPLGKLFTGTVYGIQLPGISGSFEILEKHAPLVSALGNGNIKVLNDKTGNNTTTYSIKGGFIEVMNNRVVVLVESVA
jgi:F-type H+-transporting ATPase subunit epsilon